jgi:hypothetical protein
MKISHQDDLLIPAMTSFFAHHYGGNVKKNNSCRVIPERESFHLKQTINEAFSRN